MKNLLFSLAILFAGTTLLGQTSSTPPAPSPMFYSNGTSTAARKPKRKKTPKTDSAPWVNNVYGTTPPMTYEDSPNAVEEVCEPTTPVCTEYRWVAVSHTPLPDLKLIDKLNEMEKLFTNLYIGIFALVVVSTLFLAYWLQPKPTPDLKKK
jgi:hypothetical protein